MSDLPVVLLHAGVADHRMWDGVIPALHDAGRKVVAPDLRGFGNRPIGHASFSHHRDVLSLLDGLGADRADLVGASFGAHVALEVAAVAPDRVASLALLAPPLFDWEWSDAMKEFDEAEESAVSRGDLDRAVELNVRMWAQNAGRPIQEYVAEAQRKAFEHADNGADEDELDPPVEERLASITARSLIVVGDADQPEFPAIARHLAETLPGAELRVIEGAGHLLALERPDEVGPLLAAWVRGEE